MADKAAGFNMPAVIVDGTDVLDTYEGASKIVEGVRARPTVPL